MKVGFIGLGNMGNGMAGNLLDAGHELLVYNRSPDKAQSLIQRGAKLAKDFSDFATSEAVFTMLANDEAVEDIVFNEDGLIKYLAPNAIHISSSTIGVALSAKLSEEHSKAGQNFISAPVFGRPNAAAAGELFVVAAGDKQTIEKITPLLDVIGQKTFVISEKPEAANIVKLSGNFLIASVLETVGEAMALVEKSGVDRHEYLNILTSTLFNAPVYKNYGGMIADRKFEPAGFAAPLGQKDIRLTLAAAEKLNVPMPVASLLRDRFLSLLAHGGEKLDWSAIGFIPAKEAGIKD